MYIEGQPSIASTDVFGVAAVDDNDFEIDNSGVLSVKGEEPVPIIGQATGSDTEIEAMINGYYSGVISLQDVKSVQAVGDVRQANETDKIKMKIAAHDSFSGDFYPSVIEQSTCKQVILDFDHDTLVTSIGSITKALITIQMLGMLGTSANTSEKDSYSPYAIGQMNTSNSNTGGQESSSRRTQCNGNFYNALGFKSQVKQVVKQNCADYSSSTITTTNDYCFLCSEYEIFNSINYAPGNEGIQYKYFETSSNRIKKQGQEGTGNAKSQQERSVMKNNSDAFCSVSTSGTFDYWGASSPEGISPACAL